MKSSNGVTKVMVCYGMTFVATMLISISLLAYVHSPYNKVTYQVLDDDLVRVIPSYGEHEGFEILREGNGVSIRCDIQAVHNFSMCGIAFYLPYDISSDRFIHFNEDDELSFSAEATSDVVKFDNRIRVLLKTFVNPHAVDVYHNSNTKFHAVRLQPTLNARVPLNHFKVETWWEDLYRVPYALAQRDLSKVAVIEFHFNDVPIKAAGMYTIRISDVAVTGAYLNKYSLYKSFYYFWPIFFAIFIVHYIFVRNKQLSYIKKQAHYEPHSLLFSKHGFYDRYTKFHGGYCAAYIIKATNWKVIESHFSSKTANQLFRSTNDKLIRKLNIKSLICARLADDEVVILSPGRKLSINDEKYLLQVFQEGGDIEGGTRIRLRVKIGVVIEQSLPKDPSELLLKGYRTIDSILDTGESIKYYDQGISELAKHEEFIDKQLEMALQNNAFHLLYMPVYSSEKKRLVGSEALIRCDWPALKCYGPDTYIPVAEKYGLIRQIDFWVVEEAIKTLSINLHRLRSDFVLSINISSRELLDEQFVGLFKSWLEKYSLDASRVCLEITETFFVDINHISSEAIDELRELGCGISLDDFGTGYTSFVHLMNLAVDEVKIDKSFVDLLDDSKNKAVIKSIISIGKANNYNIVAEGIESHSQMLELECMGCVRFQGYFISKPVSFEEVIKWNNDLSSDDKGLSCPQGTQANRNI